MSHRCVNPVYNFGKHVECNTSCSCATTQPSFLVQILAAQESKLKTFPVSILSQSPVHYIASHNVLFSVFFFWSLTSVRTMYEVRSKNCFDLRRLLTQM